LHADLDSLALIGQHTSSSVVWSLLVAATTHAMNSVSLWRNTDPKRRNTINVDGQTD
jgi:hypothetical protein